MVGSNPNPLESPTPGILEIVDKVFKGLDQFDIVKHLNTSIVFDHRLQILRFLIVLQSFITATNSFLATARDSELLDCSRELPGDSWHVYDHCLEILSFLIIFQRFLMTAGSFLTIDWRS